MSDETAFDKYYEEGFRTALLGLSYTGRVLRGAALEWFQEGEDIAKGLRRRFRRKLLTILWDTQKLQRETRWGYKTLKKIAERFDFELPPIEPCVECPWIALCKESERLCPRFRNYVSKSSRGSARVPDMTWKEYAHRCSRLEDTH